MSDQLVVEAATCRTHNRHKRRTSMPAGGFKPTIPAIEQPQIDVLTARLLGSAAVWLMCRKFLLRSSAD